MVIREFDKYGNYWSTDEFLKFVVILNLIDSHRIQWDIKHLVRDDYTPYLDWLLNSPISIIPFTNLVAKAWIVKLHAGRVVFGKVSIYIACRTWDLSLSTPVGWQRHKPKLIRSNTRLCFRGCATLTTNLSTVKTFHKAFRLRRRPRSHRNTKAYSE